MLKKIDVSRLSTVCSSVIKDFCSKKISESKGHGVLPQFSRFWFNFVFMVVVIAVGIIEFFFGSDFIQNLSWRLCPVYQICASVSMFWSKVGGESNGSPVSSS